MGASFDDKRCNLLVTTSNFLETSMIAGFTILMNPRHWTCHQHQERHLLLWDQK